MRATTSNGAAISEMRFAAMPRKIPVTASTRNSPSAIFGTASSTRTGHLNHGHPAFVAVLPEPLHPVVPLQGRLMVAAGLGSAHEPLVTGRGARVPQPLDQHGSAQRDVREMPSGHLGVLVLRGDLDDLDDAERYRSGHGCVVDHNALHDLGRPGERHCPGARHSCQPWSTCPLSARWPLDSTVTSSRTLVASARVRPKRVSS